MKHQRPENSLSKEKSQNCKNLLSWSKNQNIQGIQKYIGDSIKLAKASKEYHFLLKLKNQLQALDIKT